MKNPDAAMNANRQILEEATAWFVDFRLESPETAARRDFIQWLQRSPDHIRAYIDIARTYAQLPGANVVEDKELTRLLDSVRARSSLVSLQDPAATVAVLSATVSKKENPGSPARLSSRRALAAAMAGLAIGAALLISVLVVRNPTYATQTGEQRILMLEDGSRIDLNAQSRVRIRFTAGARDIELLRGQALFQVAKDVHRPFTVHSAGMRVRALGTQFDVYKKSNGTLVTVVEGRVAIQKQTGSAASVLIAGEQVIVSATSIAKPWRPNIAAATAWTQGQLEFDETPLPEVAGEFNRYTRRPLVVEPGTLDNFRISGVYASADAASLIRFLKNQPDLIVKENRSEIEVARR